MEFKQISTETVTDPNRTQILKGLGPAGIGVIAVMHNSFTPTVILLTTTEVSTIKGISDLETRSNLIDPDSGSTYGEHHCDELEFHKVLISLTLLIHLLRVSLSTVVPLQPDQYQNLSVGADDKYYIEQLRLQILSQLGVPDVASKCEVEHTRLI
ncbi:hypothetical protein WDW86_10245 [Bdellovibrionota bacterium FG-2]